MKLKLNEFRDSSLKLLKDTMDKTVDLSQQGVEFIKDNHRKNIIWRRSSNISFVSCLI